ncbi:TPA: CZB domain-containing protein [Citrobacter werkmanii]|nr:CZB domain-containing protein [Citrobacter werkmanii]
MLSPELYAVVLAHIRASALSKAFHVQYTAQKCFRLRERMLISASGCREEVQAMSFTLNRQYRMIKSLSGNGREEDTGKDQKQLLALTREQYEQTGYIQLQLTSVASEMALSADKLLFTLLKAQHYQWRDRLYIAVLTEQMNELIEDEKSCLLGRWIHGEGMRRFRALPGFRELDARHRYMHEVSMTLFDRELNRFRANDLRKTLLKTEEASQQLLAALDCLDERVGLLYPGSENT